MIMSRSRTARTVLAPLAVLAFAAGASAYSTSSDEGAVARTDGSGAASESWAAYDAAMNNLWPAAATGVGQGYVTTTTRRMPEVRRKSRPGCLSLTSATRTMTQAQNADPTTVCSRSKRCVQSGTWYRSQAQPTGERGRSACAAVASMSRIPNLTLNRVELMTHHKPGYDPKYASAANTRSADARVSQDRSNG